MNMSSLVIQTTYGPVRGSKSASHLGEEVYSFRGIPYAKPPLGPLRFKVCFKFDVFVKEKNDYYAYLLISW